MRYFLAFCLVIVACAANPSDREASRKEYEAEEAVNQKRSLTRSEMMAKVKALNARVGALDAQIKIQQDLITRYKGQEEVASSQAMIDNAKVRIRQLQKERNQVAEEREAAQEELSGI